MEPTEPPKKIYASRRSLELTRRACESLRKYLLAEDAKERAKQEEWKTRILRKARL